VDNLWITPWRFCKSKPKSKPKSPAPVDRLARRCYNVRQSRQHGGPRRPSPVCCSNHLLYISLLYDYIILSFPVSVNQRPSATMGYKSFAQPRRPPRLIALRNIPYCSYSISSKVKLVNCFLRNPTCYSTS
jgi:hypothetical protein